MKVLVAGGGTGGHVYPAIAIANELRHRHEDWQIEFVGRHNQIEGRAVPAAGYVIHNLHVSAFERFYGIKEKMEVIGRLCIAMKDSFKLLKELKPDMVIGTGGYISGPITMCAALKGIPTLISEQNVIPGFTIKTLSGFVDTVCIPFSGARDYMKKPEKCVLTGNPVRREFGLFTRELARKSLGINENQKFIFSMGGSLGAKSINDAVSEMIMRKADNKDFFFIHITGKDDYESVMNSLKEKGFDPDMYDNVKILSFTEDMPMMLNAADLVISRSGAMSLSEINYVGVPAIYIPYPYAVNDHQTKNAMFSVKNEAAVLIEDDRLTCDMLVSCVEDIVFDEEKSKKMRENSERIGIRNSSELIAQEVEKLLKITH
ncbi:MAG: undecaprenyldiphospho-muramoylpentapeptide beta-N-acetylglucosaminyltransferase [Anaerofustis stercorihominis]|nr:undecaprenyldiphospho-muramoylpentapeptide beta-N-acetylglucosaminyltransferase [Anaerofustis stercorihominis]